jgi:RimJ/RimL family protein N-acetyltransferase
MMANRLQLFEIEEMSFRESLMTDEETMSYNAKWGGTIPFPKDKWNSWYDAWVRNPGKDRFYRYLQNEEKEYVGEIAHHYDEPRDIYICDVIVLAKYRNRGYESEGIKLLCQAAKENGISILYDDIAADNPSYKLFLKNGFEIEYRNEDVVMVKKTQ